MLTLPFYLLVLMGKTGRDFERILLMKSVREKRE